MTPRNIHGNGRLASWLCACLLLWCLLPVTTLQAQTTVPPQEINFTDIKRKADKGIVEAQYNLGVCYQKGYGVEIDRNEAVAWYTVAAQRGFAMAQYNLGLCYAEGYGVEKNNAEAARLPSGCRAGACQGML